MTEVLLAAIFAPSPAFSQGHAGADGYVADDRAESMRRNDTRVWAALKMRA